MHSAAGLGSPGFHRRGLHADAQHDPKDGGREKSQGLREVLSAATGQMATAKRFVARDFPTEESVLRGCSRQSSPEKQSSQDMYIQEIGLL